MGHTLSTTFFSILCTIHSMNYIPHFHPTPPHPLIHPLCQLRPHQASFFPHLSINYFSLPPHVISAWLFPPIRFRSPIFGTRPQTTISIRNLPRRVARKTMNATQRFSVILGVSRFFECYLHFIVFSLHEFGSAFIYSCENIVFFYY